VDLGYRLLAESETEVELAAPVLDSSLQVDGWVHGGMLATLADTAGRISSTVAFLPIAG